MKNALRHLSILALFPLCGAAFCPQGPDLLAAMNYQPLTPPTNLMVPGAVLAIEEGIIDGQKQEKLQMSCGPRASLGEEAQMMQSVTIDQSFNDKKKSSWKLDAAGMSRLGLNVDGAHIKNVTVSITNAKVLSLSDADVLANLHNRSEACKAAIKQRLANNFKMTMISSALVADMVWAVEWDEQLSAKMSAKDKLLEMQKIAANLGGGHSRIGQKKIESKQIAIGIRTDAFLLALTVPEMDSWPNRVMEQAAAEKIGSHLPARADVSAPDAPYVLPKGGTYLSPEVIWED